MGFVHRRLEVYSRSVAWGVAAFRVAYALPEPWRFLGDQLRRAAVSIPLNLAEGVAESSSREQSRILRIARRSAAECDAALHLLQTAGQIDDTAEMIAELNRISAMITGLIRQSDSRFKQ